MGSGLVGVGYRRVSVDKSSEIKFRFEELDVWQLAFEYAKKVYLITKEFPKDEVYGITSQLRRASLSVSLNIAEGKGRFSNREFKQFLFVSRGSLYESITLIKFSKELSYISVGQHDELICDSMSILSKISGLLNFLKSNQCDLKPGSQSPKPGALS